MLSGVCNIKAIHIALWVHQNIVPDCENKVTLSCIARPCMRNPIIDLESRPKNERESIFILFKNTFILLYLTTILDLVVRTRGLYYQ